MSQTTPETADEQRRFIHDYGQFLRSELDNQRRRLLGLLREWRSSAYWTDYREAPLPSPTPVLRTNVRMKRPEAVVDRILRSPAEFPDGLSMQSVRKMSDLLGARIVVPFLGHMILVDTELESRADIVTVAGREPRAYLRTDDPMRSSERLSSFEQIPKQWGSPALIYWLQFLDDEDKRSHPFELQVVTLLDDAWGDIQRQLGHRAQDRPPSASAQEKLSDLGAQVSELDERLAALYRELADQQRRSEPGADEDPLSAENLPRLLNAVGIECAQAELEGMLKVLASRGVDSIGDMKARANAEVVAEIRDIYVGEAGWAPSSFELVATLAMLGPNPRRKEVAAAARLNIEYLEAWDETMRESQTPRDDWRVFLPRRSTSSRILRRG
jgi:ppGpp synthetase/RelA/SpoT-type nucleotidyltranferase